MTTTTDTTSTPTIADRRSEFVPVEGSAQETTSAAGLLLSAYILMWALVFGFLWLTLKKQKQLDARLQEVERALAERDANTSTSSI